MHTYRYFIESTQCIIEQQSMSLIPNTLMWAVREGFDHLSSAWDRGEATSEKITIYRDDKLLGGVTITVHELTATHSIAKAVITVNGKSSHLRTMTISE